MLLFKAQKRANVEPVGTEIAPNGQPVCRGSVCSVTLPVYMGSEYMPVFRVRRTELFFPHSVVAQTQNLKMVKLLIFSLLFAVGRDIL